MTSPHSSCSRAMTNEWVLLGCMKSVRKWLQIIGCRKKLISGHNNDIMMVVFVSESECLYGPLLRVMYKLELPGNLCNTYQLVVIHVLHPITHQMITVIFLQNTYKITTYIDVTLSIAKLLSAQRLIYFQSCQCYTVWQFALYEI